MRKVFEPDPVKAQRYNGTLVYGNANGTGSGMSISASILTPHIRNTRRAIMINMQITTI